MPGTLLSEMHEEIHAIGGSTTYSKNPGRIAMRRRAYAIDRRGGTAAVIRRIAILVSSGSLALLALVLPTGPDGVGFLPNPAFAAGQDSGSAGNGTGPGSGSGQQTKNDLSGSAAAIDEDAQSEIAGSSDSSAGSAPLSGTGQGASAPLVIKEVAGVTGDTELSAEEEREAIRSGWGTWRTADGPESVMAQ